MIAAFWFWQEALWQRIDAYTQIMTGSQKFSDSCICASADIIYFSPIQYTTVAILMSQRFFYL